MTYIIAEPCVDLKDGACVDVCPVDCIYTTDDDNQYYINSLTHKTPDDKTHWLRPIDGLPWPWHSDAAHVSRMKIRARNRAG